MKQAIESSSFNIQEHIYIQHDFLKVLLSSQWAHEKINEIIEVIKQILNHDTNELEHRDYFNWDELVSKVQAWDCRVGFSWQIPNDESDKFPLRINPVKYSPIRLGARRNKEAAGEIVSLSVICQQKLLFSFFLCDDRSLIF